jgi:phage terminase large subunit-like protein
MADDLDNIIHLIPNYDPTLSAGDCHFDFESAQKAIDFIQKYLSLSKNSAKADMGAPFILESWQKAIIANLFGWFRPDGSRRYRESFILVPRKNGKSEALAAIVNYVGFCDNEKGGEIYSAGADRGQASLVFNSAKQMIVANPKLSSRAKIYQNSIVFPHNTTYKSLSAESYSKHGLNASLICIDELHAIQDRDLIDVLTTSTGSRRQPLVIYITTADFVRVSIYWEIYKRACQARDAKSVSDVGYDPSFLPVIYEAGQDDDWTSPETWKKANPNLGVSIQLDYLEKHCKQALDTPSYENTFKRLHLNLATESHQRWLSSTDWQKCGDNKIDLAELDGQDCIGTLDLSTLYDLTCFALYFPSQKVFLPFFFVPKDNSFKRERLDKVPYATWAKQGFIIETPGNIVDYEFVKAKIIELSDKYNILKIAYDKWNASATALWLQDKGLEMTEYRQGFMSMNEPSKELERLVSNHELVHLNNPVLNWMSNNVTIEINPEGSIKPSKAKSTERIDGIVCLVMGIGVAMLSETPTAPSIYKL